MTHQEEALREDIKELTYVAGASAGTLLLVDAVLRHIVDDGLDNMTQHNFELLHEAQTKIRDVIDRLNEPKAMAMLRYQI